MFGEDIEICYETKKIGMNNFYSATSTLVHFKGESTKNDINYLAGFSTECMVLWIEKMGSKKIQKHVFPAFHNVCLAYRTHANKGRGFYSKIVFWT